MVCGVQALAAQSGAKPEFVTAGASYYDINQGQLGICAVTPLFALDYRLPSMSLACWTRVLGIHFPREITMSTYQKLDVAKYRNCYFIQSMLDTCFREKFCPKNYKVLPTKN